MPTSATHITIVQRLAAMPRYSGVLGNPDPTLPITDAAAIKMRFAALGSCGPDVFYALADFNTGGGDLQNLEDFLVKTAATFDGLAETLSAMQDAIDSAVNTITLGISGQLQATSQMLSATINEGLYALVAAGGFNPLAFFVPPRQRDKPRTGWFWADVLHYWRTGKFVSNLVAEAQAQGNPNLIAYANGYVTHYVTDVVGHPYVNQIVGSPWRQHWQRHHLVENFIDAFVWDQWHVPLPQAAGAKEPPLDRLVGSPNAMGMGAPATYARLNDHINIGGNITLGDPVDSIVDAVTSSLNSLLGSIGVSVPVEPAPPTDADFMAWTTMMAKVLHKTYGDYHPTNLNASFFVQGKTASRADGFPTEEDIAAAYGAFRLLMRVATEETVKDPVAPSITTDISAAAAKIAADVAADLGGIPPPPAIPSGGSFSLAAIVDAVEKAFEWAAAVADATVKAGFDAINDAIAAGGAVAADVIKYALWLIAKALFAIYRAFRDVLTLRAYALPYGDQLDVTFGALRTTTLWQVPAPPMVSASAHYPSEESVGLAGQPDEEAIIFSSYVPTAVPPLAAELPELAFAGPYTHLLPPPAGSGTVGLLEFIDAPLGPNDMFDATNGPQRAVSGRGRPPGFAATPKNYGGAIANCMRALDMVAGPTPPQFPDYNLDGDRTYGWPCWDVAKNAKLNPKNATPPGIATVTAVRIS